MKKIINQPDNYIKEMLEGIYIAHKDDLACVDGDLQVLVWLRCRGRRWFR